VRDFGSGSDVVAPTAQEAVPNSEQRVVSPKAKTEYE
jgi:hypothetical protein